MDKLFLLSNDKVGQTSTISENSNHFQQDWVLVKPGEAFEFPAIKGPTYISNLAITGWPGEPNSNLKWIMDRLEKGQFLKQLLFTDVSYLQSVDIKIYFDDATIPNVDSTFANFFGAGFGRYTPYDSLYLGMTSGEFYSRFPMPFKESCVVKIENKGNENLILFGEITHHKLDSMPKSWAYFNATQNQLELTKNEPYKILEVQGSGHFIGCNVSLTGKSFWKSLFFLEGDLRIYLDSNKKPQIEYDGTESYFMGGWYFIKGTFFSPDHGCLVKDWFRRKIQAYRFHPDKVSFKKNIKITLDHGENNEIPVHYSSVAFWYSRP